MNEIAIERPWKQPSGLAELFFFELWERFAYYGMRALLVIYMVKSAIAAEDPEAFRVYSVYTTLVFLAPVFCSALTCRLVSNRQGVVLGALFMIAGLELIAVPETGALHAALGLICVGNGFMKPAITAQVGTLYGRNDQRRGPGFLIYYLGINLGAGLAPLVCGYLGVTEGWNVGFNAAALAMIAGLLIFVGTAPIKGVMSAAIVVFVTHGVVKSIAEQFDTNLITRTAHGALLFFLLAAAFWAWKNLVKEQAPRDSQSDLQPTAGQFPEDQESGAIDLGTPSTSFWRVPLAIIVGLILTYGAYHAVSGFTSFTEDGKILHFGSHDEQMAKMETTTKFAVAVKLEFYRLMTTVPGRMLIATLTALILYFIGLACLQRKDTWRGIVALLVLSLFSTCFWGFYEYLGSSLTRLADLHVDRVIEERVVTEDDVGKFLPIQLTQEQIGYEFRLREVDVDRYEALRARDSGQASQWLIKKEHVGMGIARPQDEIPAASFQILNIFGVLILGILMAGIWAVMIYRGIRIGTLYSFAFGFMLFALGCGLLYYGLKSVDHRGMMSISLHVSAMFVCAGAELFISPIGLATVTRLAPRGHVRLFLAYWFGVTMLSTSIGSIAYRLTTNRLHASKSPEDLPATDLDFLELIFRNTGLAALGLAVCCAVLTIFMRQMIDPDD